MKALEAIRGEISELTEQARSLTEDDKGEPIELDEAGEEALRTVTEQISARTAAAERLRCVSICIANIGLARPAESQAHWLYFPEPVYPFYRVGITTNVAPAMAPPGCHVLSVEATLPFATRNGCAGRWGVIRRGLERAGLLLRGEEPAVVDLVHVPYAYVLYDRHRARVLPGLLGELESRGVCSIGRYGAWEYGTMEDALWQGMEAAHRIGSSQS